MEVSGTRYKAGSRRQDILREIVRFERKLVNEAGKSLVNKI
jgi:hypothetical protein